MVRWRFLDLAAELSEDEVGNGLARMPGRGAEEVVELCRPLLVVGPRRECHVVAGLLPVLPNREAFDARASRGTLSHMPSMASRARRLEEIMRSPSFSRVKGKKRLLPLRRRLVIAVRATVMTQGGDHQSRDPVSPLVEH
jgi:hypothetical protein